MPGAVLGTFRNGSRLTVLPKRADRLPPSVFVKRIAKVEVGDVKTEVPYSVVRKILAWETGAMAHQLINQSTIKEGIREDAQKQHVKENACQSEKRVTLENDAPAKTSALAGVESNNSIQLKGGRLATVSRKGILCQMSTERKGWPISRLRLLRSRNLDAKAMHMHAYTKRGCNATVRDWYEKTSRTGPFLPTLPPSYKGLQAVVFQLVASLVRTAFTGPVERRRKVDGEILRLAGYSQHQKEYEQYKNGPEHDSAPFWSPIVVCSLFFMTKARTVPTLEIVIFRLVAS